ncbi:MAG: hypothetical protein HOA57_04035 [Candidatus Magasanikbacteria bacterium]|jgi:hypothetical protein|nr:hypothetical protein [Candidatus Magasanikbacteria bacterium]MBT4314636.1 hypothetical protein [Candidatus Magasanikbacteria bacterium]MBT4547057.1 hypothetical protein [Candidatus Magasanikbacteria bacterium]MBT6819517.1 hypothetical protein [Candidatus Magasanikbacteria bacterium]
MSFLIIFLLGLSLVYLFEKDKFKSFEYVELVVVSFGVGLCALVVFGVVVF